MPNLFLLAMPGVSKETKHKAVQELFRGKFKGLYWVGKEWENISTNCG